MMTNKCEYGEDLVCRTCGHRARSLPSYRTCRKQPLREAVQRPFELPTDPAFYGRPPWYFRWGDMLKAFLSFFGMTEKRYAAIKELFSKSSSRKGCGCEGRREKMNTAGYWTWRVLMRIAARLPHPLRTTG